MCARMRACSPNHEKSVRVCVCGIPSYCRPTPSAYMSGLTSSGACSPRQEKRVCARACVHARVRHTLLFSPSSTSVYERSHSQWGLLSDTRGDLACVCAPAACSPKHEKIVRAYMRHTLLLSPSSISVYERSHSQWGRLAKTREVRACMRVCSIPTCCHLAQSACTNGPTDTGPRLPRQEKSASVCVCTRHTLLLSPSSISVYERSHSQWGLLSSSAVYRSALL